MKWAKPKRNKNKQRNIGMEQPEFSQAAYHIIYLQSFFRHLNTRLFHIYYL